jgi:hypothetical protein
MDRYGVLDLFEGLYCALAKQPPGALDEASVGGYRKALSGRSVNSIR